MSDADDAFMRYFDHWFGTTSRVTSAVTNWPGGRIGHPCVGRLVSGLLDGTALGDRALDRVGPRQRSTYATHRCTGHLSLRWGLIAAYRRNGSPGYTLNYGRPTPRPPFGRYRHRWIIKINFFVI